MGKKKLESKKKAGKPANVKALEPPFVVHMNNLADEQGACVLQLNTEASVQFKEIEVEVRLFRSSNTRKLKYDLKVVKTKTEPRVPGIYAPEELLPFPINNVETEKTLTIDPGRTDGLAPYLMIDRDTQEESLIVPPYFIHYELSNRKRYLLNLQNFMGNFQFKDFETKEDVTVDLTKRVDPLNGAPLYGEYENPPRQFVQTMNNGTAYIVKDLATGNIEIIGVTGDKLIGYKTQYDPISNKTIVSNDQSEVVAEIEGEHEIAQTSPLEGDPVGENEGGHEVELGGFLFEKLTTEKKNEKDADLKKELTDMLYKRLGVYYPSEYHLVRDTETQSPLFVNKDGKLIESQQYRLEMDPLTGTIRIVDYTGHPVHNVTELDTAELLIQLPDGFYFVPNEMGHMELASASGHLLQFNLDTDAPMPKELQRNTEIDSLLKSSSVEEKRHPLEEEYFESLRMEEAWIILNEANRLSWDEGYDLLKACIDMVEKEKGFVQEALRDKLNEEKKFVEKALSEKQARQVEFIKKAIKTHNNPYTRAGLQTEILKKLDRENRLILDRLDARVDQENYCLNDVLQQELKCCKASFVRKTNRTCFKAIKGIVYKQLSLMLEKEKELIHEEMSRMFALEAAAIMKHVMTMKLSPHKVSCSTKSNTVSPQDSTYQYFRVEYKKPPYGSSSRISCSDVYASNSDISERQTHNDKENGRPDPPYDKEYDSLTEKTDITVIDFENDIDIMGQRNKN